MLIDPLRFLGFKQWQHIVWREVFFFVHCCKLIFQEKKEQVIQLKLLRRPGRFPKLTQQRVILKGYPPKVNDMIKGSYISVTFLFTEDSAHCASA